MTKRVPNAQVKNVVLPAIVGLLIAAAAAVISSEFDWKWVIAAAVGGTFVLGLTAVVTWLRATWLRSKGFEPVALGEGDHPGVRSLPTPLRSVRVMAALNVVTFALTSGIAGVLLEDLWIAAYGAAVGVWAAMVLLASWALRRQTLEDKGFLW